MSVKVKLSHCPHCNYRVDGATHLKDAKLAPGPGDITMCISCGGWSVFDRRMRLRLPTSEEQLWIDNNPACTGMHTTWKEMINGC